MVKDALTTSHPVSTPIATPDDIAESFDSISYSKVKHCNLTALHAQSITKKLKSTFSYKNWIFLGQYNDALAKTEDSDFVLSFIESFH